MDCKSIIENNFIISNKSTRKYISFKNGILFISINTEHFDEETIKQVIRCFRYVHTKYKTKNSICLEFPKIKIIDKLSYVILECICKSLIQNFGHRIVVKGKFTSNILTSGFTSSPLQLLTGNRQATMNIKQDFVKSFYYDIFGRHYRKIFNYDEYNNNRGKLCREFDDICSFQKSFNVNYDCMEDIAEVIVELVGNSIEHSKSDCLLDIDVAPHYVKENSDGEYCGINITILNLSNILLGDGIKNKLTNYTPQNTNNKDRYAKVLKAFDYHKKFFSKDYDEQDFFNITAFQDKISGRTDNSITGGTGLTLLIKSIQERADMQTCYVHTGNRLVFLHLPFLGYDNNNWLGFNESSDYFEHIPDQNAVGRSSIYVPGTAYNLNLIMKVNNDE